MYEGTAAEPNVNNCPHRSSSLGNSKTLKQWPRPDIHQEELIRPLDLLACDLFVIRTYISFPNVMTLTASFTHDTITH